MTEELSIFEFMYETFKFSKKKITLIELFSGIGSQATALEKLAGEYGFELDVLGVSEIDKYAIQSYNAIFGDTHNFGNIMDIKELPYTDILTYSFPCQDISLAGKGKGFAKGSGSRSGLLWEVERILDRQKEIGKLPQVLLMENVKALASVKFVDDFNKWKYKLQELGYSNYWEILNAKDYGIPQNRERVFMVSILGEWNYTFPKPFPLELRLKDMLENDVDDKYYLSEKMIKFFKKNSEEQQAKGNGFRFEPSDGTKEAKAITTRAGARMDDNFIQQEYENTEPKIYCSYALSSREHQAQGWKEIMPTLTARDYKDPKVVCIPKVVTKGNYSASNHNASRIVDEKGIAPTVMENHGTVTAVQIQPKDRYYNKNGKNREEQIESRNDELANAVLTNDRKNMIKETLRIRKLTPKECWRLMGFSDEQFEKAKQVCSNSQLYKQAGNSIVVDVLYYIFKQLF